MFDQFLSNFTKMMEQENRNGHSKRSNRETEPVRLASLLGSFIVPELKNNSENNFYQIETPLKSYIFCL